MQQKDLDPNNLGIDEDKAGNNAAFRCPHCRKVFIVSGSRRVHNGVRKCPNCGRSTGYCDEKGNTARLEW